jgi:hypothetical protein
VLTLERVTRAVLPKPDPGRFFSKHEAAALRAVAEILLEDSPVSISADEVVRNVDTFFGSGRFSRRAWRVRALCQLVELAPLSLKEYRRPFSRLTRDERVRIIRERFIGGRYLWGVCANIRLIAYVGLYGDRRAEPAVGFVPVMERARFRRTEPERAQVY